MKALLGTVLFTLAAMAQAQGLEADLDGNASALQASEMRPAAKAPRPQASPAKKEVAGRQSRRS
jgi:hypothetical protein